MVENFARRLIDDCCDFVTVPWRFGRMIDWSSSGKRPRSHLNFVLIFFFFFVAINFLSTYSRFNLAPTGIWRIKESIFDASFVAVGIRFLMTRGLHIRPAVNTRGKTLLSFGSIVPLIMNKFLIF